MVGVWHVAAAVDACGGFGGLVAWWLVYLVVVFLFYLLWWRGGGGLMYIGTYIISKMFIACVLAGASLINMSMADGRFM